ncbi:MAG TPA: PaaI family thioesterase [Jatrophihabitans sp.]|nr:PaaI family thioesterase [Jatrophihabitans sp.]
MYEELAKIGLDAALGFTIDEAGADRVTLSWTVGEQHLQPYGIVHGGVHCAAVESSASIGAAIWFGERGRVVGVSNHTNFLRSAHAGVRLTATATPIHRGRLQQLWVVEIADDQQRQVARGEVRLQNLAAPAAGQPQ